VKLILPAFLTGIGHCLSSRSSYCQAWMDWWTSG